MNQRIVVITGGAEGIGAASAKTFIDHQDVVYIFDIKKPDFADNHSVHYIPCDMTNIKQINASVKQVLDEQGRIDVLVGNAGIHLSKTIEETSDEDYWKVLNTNFTGTFFLLKAILPAMKKEKRGTILLVASEQVFVGKPNSAIYGATKAALAQLTKSTALDYAKYNIRVNAVCPGTVDTPLYRNAIERYSKASGIPLSEIEKEEAALQPLNRVGNAEEVGKFIFYLCSEDAAFMTGGLYPIDGGYTAR